MVETPSPAEIDAWLVQARAFILAEAEGFVGVSGEIVCPRCGAKLMYQVNSGGADERQLPDV